MQTVKTAPPEGVRADTMALIVATLAENGARTVLDVGCGPGRLSAGLASRGFAVTGIDPQPAAVEAARAAVADARFEVAGAQALPFDDASFDAAVFLNSLHHVPEPLMRGALAEALRVIGPARALIVIEPLAQGGFFEVMRPVEDETEIRAAAARAIEAAVGEGEIRLDARIVYDRVTRYADVGAFIDALVSVDPDRAQAAAGRRAELEGLFAAHATPAGDQFALVQPLVFYRLSAA